MEIKKKLKSTVTRLNNAKSQWLKEVCLLWAWESQLVLVLLGCKAVDVRLCSCSNGHRIPRKRPFWARLFQAQFRKSFAWYIPTELYVLVGIQSFDFAASFHSQTTADLYGFLLKLPEFFLSVFYAELRKDFVPLFWRKFVVWLEPGDVRSNRVTLSWLLVLNSDVKTSAACLWIWLLGERGVGETMETSRDSLQRTFQFWSVNNDHYNWILRRGVWVSARACVRACVRRLSLHN